MAISEVYKDFQVGVDEPGVIRLAEALALAAPKARVIKGRDQDTPDALLTGRYTSLEVARDVHFFSCDMVFDTMFQTSGQLPPSLWLGALFSGTWRTQIGGQALDLPPDGTPRFIINNGHTQYLDQPVARDRVRMVSFLIGESFFERAAQDDPRGRLAGLYHYFRNDLHIHSAPESRSIRENLLRLLNNPYRGTTSVIFVESLIMASLFDLAEQFPGTVSAETKDRRMIAYEAKAMIDEAPEQFTSILSLAQTLGSNETTLQRQFRKAFDTTIFEYVLRRRMTCAQMLVRDGHLSISEISYRVGYNSPANFSTAYKRFFGFSPAQHRQGRTS